MDTIKEFTVREVYEALEKNGFEHLRGEWTETKNGLIVAGCALAQAGLNLGTAYSSEQYGINYHLNKFYPSETSKWRIPPELSEGEVTNLDDPAEALKNAYLGDLIVTWNDLYIRTRWSDEPPKYVLQTWDEVAAMAKELMEPFFDETVNLRMVEWEYQRNEPVVV